MRDGTLRTFALAMLGTLLLQASWVLAVPPFRGLDEHEHAFKAAAVVQGDLGWAHEPAPLGWGEMLVVPRTLVEAAAPECRELPYTTSDNCSPGRPHGDGLVEVASSAASYNPAFYALVGLPTLLLDSGTASLYAMRLVGALCCALLIATVAVLVRRHARSSWLGATVVAAISPVMLYSSTVVAPNGLEMCAGLLLWCSLLVWAQQPHVHPPRLLPIVAGAAATLALLRSLGPLWLLLIVLTVAWLRPSLVQQLWTRRAAPALGVVAVAATAGAAWTMAAGTNSTSGLAETFGRPGVPELAGQVALWLFQSVAAFPARNELAPVAVYALVLLVWWVLIAVAFRAASTRERTGGLIVVVVATVVPLAITVVTYATIGNAWQGRYTYPYSIGLLLIAGFALERARVRGSRIVLLLVAAATATAHAVSVTRVLSAQLASSPQAGTAAWPAPAGWALALLVVTGMVLLSAACAPSRATTSPSP